MVDKAIQQMVIKEDAEGAFNKGEMKLMIVLEHEDIPRCGNEKN